MRAGPDRAASRAQRRARWFRRLRGPSGPGFSGGTGAWALVPLVLALGMPLRAEAPAAGVDAATRADLVALTVRYMVSRQAEIAAARELCLELPGEAAATLERAVGALGDLGEGRAVRGGAPCPEPPGAGSLRVVLQFEPIRELADRIDVAATVGAPDGRQTRFVYYPVIIAGEWTVTGYLEPRPKSS